MALRYISTKETWKGEPIGGVVYPRTIANLTGPGTAERLARIGLEKVPEPEVTPAAVTVEDIEAETGRRITARFPMHAQANAQARATELLEILTVPPVRVWTEAEATEAAWLRLARSWIAEVRAAGKLLEEEPSNDYKISDVWPAEFETWAAAAIVEAQSGGTE